MFTTVRALFWHHWLRSWKTLLPLPVVCFGIPCLIYGMLLLVPLDSTTAVSARVSLSYQMIALVAFGSIAAGFVDVQSGRLGLPRHLLSLPVTTGRLATAHLAFEAVVVGVVSSLMLVPHVAVFGWSVQGEHSEVMLSCWAIPLTCVTASALFMSALIFASGSNEIVSGVAGLGAFILGGLSFFPVLVFLDFRLYLLPLCLAGMGVAYGLTYAGIAEMRSVRWDSSFLVALAERVTAPLVRKRPFRSPDEALAWYGLRRFGLPFLVLALAAAPCFAIVWSSVNRGMFHIRMLTGGVYAGIIFSAVAVCGVATQAIQGYAAERGRYTFEFSLPVRTARLARAWWGGQSRALAIAYAVVTLPLLMLYVVVYGPNVTEFVSICLGTAVAAWIAMWFPVPVIFSWMWLFLPYALITDFTSFDTQTVWQWLVAVCGALFAAVWLSAFGWAMRRKLLNRAGVCGCAVVGALGLAAGVAALVHEGRGLENVPRDGLVGFAVVWLLCLLPFAAAPAAIDWFRHR